MLSYSLSQTAKVTTILSYNLKRNPTQPEPPMPQVEKKIGQLVEQ